jgi:hypothetical protein
VALLQATKPFAISETQARYETHQGSGNLAPWPSSLSDSYGSLLPIKGFLDEEPRSGRANET